MPQLPTPIFTLIASTADYNRFALEAVSGGSEYKIFRAELPDYSDEVELYYGMADYFEDSDVEPSTTYYYRAIALANGSYDDSNYANVTVGTPASNPLNTPTLSNIAIDRFFSRWAIGVVAGAMHYIIERTTEPTFSMPDTFISEETLWEDSGLTPGVQYYYRAKAVPYPGSGFTNSAWSTVQDITTLEYPALPKPDISASDTTENSTKITITPVLGAETYSIYRSVDPGFGTSVSVYFGPLITYIDAPLIDDTTYHYRVQANATSSKAASPFSDIISITTLESEIINPSDDPIPGLKYRMAFNDTDGVGYDVRLYFKGWVGGLTELTGGPDPVIITYSGSDSDIYDKVIVDAKHTINALNPGFSEGFYEDITGINDKDVWVRIERESDNYVFSGWLISDEFRRTFDQTVYEIALPVVSPFSIMKTTDLVEDDLKMMFGDKSLSEIVTRCIASSIHPSLAAKYEIHSTLRERDYIGSLDLFSQLREYMEAFNDDNGRPPKCYDMIEKIAASLGFICFWVNDTLIFKDPYDYDAQSPVNIGIKKIGDTTNFLIGNSESITKARSSKEVSNKIEYGRSVGLLPDGRFLQATGGALNFWYYFDLRDENNNVIFSINPSTVVRKGNGRKANPYRMRFLGEIPLEGRRMFLQSESWYQGLTVQTPRLRTNDLVTIAINFKYFDWRRKYNREQANQIDEKVPYLYVMVLAIPPNDDWRGVQFWADMKNIEGTNIDIIESSNPFPFWFPNLPISGAVTPIAIAIESNTNIQKFESTLKWKFPQGWNMQISILGMRWDEGKPVAISSSDLWVDVLDVIVSKQTDAEGYNSTGEVTYLTQDIESSQIDETKDIYIGNFDTPDISGALLKGDNTPSKGLARGGQDARIQYWLLRAMMAQKRTPKYKIDCQFKSSAIKPTDLIRFVDGGNDLMPNKYAIGAIEYNLKSAECKVTAIEINKQDREYIVGGEEHDEPNSDYDMLENYKTY